VCTSSSLTYVDPRTDRVTGAEQFALPDPRLFQPALRSDSVQYRDVTAAPQAYDCGSWSWDDSLDNIAGSSEGRLATLELRRDTITYVTAPQQGPVVTRCCDAYDPTSEALWYVHAVAQGDGTLGYQLVHATPGPADTSTSSTTTYFGQQAALAFTATGTPMIGELVAAGPSDGPYRVDWQPFATSEHRAPPPILPESDLQYGLEGTLPLPGLSIGVVRHSDDGSEAAFTASSGHDCELWTVPVAGGTPHRVGPRPYSPPDQGGAGCGAEVVRYVL
jgi:hypothetical protein